MILPGYILMVVSNAIICIALSIKGNDSDTTIAFFITAAILSVMLLLFPQSIILWIYLGLDISIGIISTFLISKKYLSLDAKNKREIKSLERQIRLEQTRINHLKKIQELSSTLDMIQNKELNDLLTNE